VATTQAKNDPKSAKKGSGGFKSSRGSVFGKLEQVFDDVWWAWGTVRFGPGVLFPRNMTIVREPDGLVVIHPIVMPEADQKQIEALGPIKHIVRLGAFHGMDDLAYQQRYGAQAWLPPGVDTAAELRRDRDLVPGGELPIAGASLHSIEASRTAETLIHMPRHGGVLLSCDSVQNWETTTGCSFLGGAMARVMGFRGRACIGPGWRRASEPRDGIGFRRDFERLLALDFRHAIGAHGAPIKDTARDDLRAQVAKLYKL
jgi:hypothetical protein